MRRSVGWVLGFVLLLVAGCANIPEESTPHAVRDNQQPVTDVAEEPPTPNLNAFDLVREFVRRSGNPEAARMYLTERAKKNWGSDTKPTIIHDTFGTLPEPNNEKGSGSGEGGAADATVTVVLRATLLGRLGTDSAFIPAIGQNEYRVGVRRENGQWRIDQPPQGVFVPISDFATAYRQVTVYFFDPDLRITVPDLRYVSAQPATGLPARVISTLLNGPSDSMRGSLKNPLEGITARTNVVPSADGTLTVELTPLGDKSEDEREQIAAQIVLSLQSVTSARLRIKADNSDLIPGHGDWRLSDLKQYDAPTKPNPDQPGLVAGDGRLRNLLDGKPIQGPAGNGEYNVISGAQSIDGSQLAVVTNVGGKPRLRVGRYGDAMQEIGVDAATMTRPTWRVSTAQGQDASEVWTVEDGNVVRIVRTGNESWTSVEVNASALEPFGTITQLRLSRDGTRAAMITSSGKLVLAAVNRDKDSVILASPRTLQPTMIVAANGVDWSNQHTVVVTTEQTSLPVISVPVDGYSIDTYDYNNLQLPVKAVTAAPDRDLVVTDSAAVSTVPGPGQVWRRLQNGQGTAAIPFYPG